MSKEFDFLSLANEYDFSSDNINVFLMVLDSSGSMEDDTFNVRKGLEAYKKDFENFYEANSIVVSASSFDSHYYPKPFVKVRNMSTAYSTGGRTALCFSIVQGAEQLKTYIEEVSRRTGVIPRATFILFSDGQPCDDPVEPSRAKEAIEELNYAGITTVFVAFGNAISSEFGKIMGFQSTRDVNDRNSLVDFMVEELSKSCKEQSQSMKALGADFFSHATDKESSANYSNTTKQALEDDDWIDEI